MEKNSNSLPENTNDGLPFDEQEDVAAPEYAEGGGERTHNIYTRYSKRRPGVAKDVYRRVRDARKNFEGVAGAPTAESGILDGGASLLQEPQVATFRASSARAGARSGIKTTGRAAARWLIFVAVYAYVVQFVFAIIAFGMLGVLVAAKIAVEEAGVVGTVVSYLFSAAKSVLDMFIEIPNPEVIGQVFWLLSFFVALSVFLGFMLVFYLLEIPFIHSVLSTLLLFVCIALCYVFPLFPGTLIWIVVVLGSYTLASAREIMGV